jgi:para-aminobenzoate synthetase/4-amino-4-deoxychorismate lyase
MPGSQKATQIGNMVGNGIYPLPDPTKRWLMQTVLLLETNRFDKDNKKSYFFTNPTIIIKCYSLDEVVSAIEEIETWVEKGFYAAGFISYEAGYAFEKSFNLKRKYNFPLVWFGIFKSPSPRSEFTPLQAGFHVLRSTFKNYSLKNLHLNISKKHYLERIRAIKTQIERGNTYQVNYTMKYKFDFAGSVESLYHDLCQKQSVPYSALIKADDFSILSFSPELFFRKKGPYIYVRPMKGTMPRGKDNAADEETRQFLSRDSKNRSENVMIVDLLRNDLGRICQSGTVITEKLFETEKYETLFQMTSSVKGKLKKKTSLVDLFRNIFPSGSVTGAPKISTMRIISQLEKEPRKVYCGAIGYIAPNKDMVFNVAIRTILLGARGQRPGTRKGEMGIGGGIIYDSDPHAEFEECKLKANFLTNPLIRFDLIETMLWDNGYPLLKLHLNRLQNSAEYFDFKFDRGRIISALKKEARKFKKGQKYKIRLLLSKTGSINCKTSCLSVLVAKKQSATKAPRHKEKPFVTISHKQTSSNDIFLYHKTTHRNLYNQEHENCSRKGFFDVIFTNEKGEVTEGAISNVFIKKNGTLYTPPLECGLLPGIYRQYLLQHPKIKVKEKKLTKNDLQKASEIYLANAVKGLIKVVLLT